MENVAHSLFGVVLGETVARLSLGKIRKSDPKQAARFRAGILWASVLGSNLPDFDFLLRPFVGGGLGSLLHHRGYTHQVLLSVPLAMVAAGAVRLATRRKHAGDAVARTSWRLLFVAAWIGVLCHIGADFWNDYGVHPFWPVVNRWFYGDFIFIVEPLFWLGLLPFVFKISRSTWARAVCLLLGGLILVLAWSGKFMTWPVALGLSIWLVMWSLIYSWTHSVAWAYAAIAAVLILFAVPAQLVRVRVASLLPPDEKIIELSTTPAPSNPLCWRVIVTSRLPAPVGSPPLDYFAREGVMVFQPGGLGANGGFGPNDPARCPPRVFGENNALTSAVVAPSLLVPGVKWAGEFRGNLAEFAAAVKTHCRVRALLRFVRMPFWVIAPSGDMIAGDLRYHSGHGLGFADIESHQGEKCYGREPDWEPSSGLFGANFGHI